MPAFMPMRFRIGPLTITTGPTKCVVASTPWTLNASEHAASTAAITTGRYSGRQPAITALMAIFSTVEPPRLARLAVLVHLREPQCAQDRGRVGGAADVDLELLATLHPAVDGRRAFEGEPAARPAVDAAHPQHAASRRVEQKVPLLL